jgi:hypothetical protein
MAFGGLGMGRRVHPALEIVLDGASARALQHGMKTIFECAFGVEAHIVSDVLRTEGIENTVLGEYLQGGAGELPVGRLVRVVVDDADADAARAVIAAWESAQPF